MQIKAVIPKFDIDNLKFKINTKNKSGSLEVGVLQGKYPNGLNLAQNAKYQEFGTYNIPPRPFFRNSIKENKKKWVEAYKTGFKKRDSNVSDRVGILVSSDIKTTITKLQTPPNAQSTINRKKSSNPLIDTGLLRASIDYKVKQ